ncbi:MAG: dihydrofolate reductase [Planctomycetota bacterium]|jgi:dihydrofolate reductase
MTISLIAAISNNRVIGADNDLPWRLPADLRYFMRTTSGHAVIMGRKTFDSIQKPLPNRRNIVVSRDPDLAIEGAETVTSLDDALALLAGEDESFICGGEQIYRLALPLADRIYLTHIDTEAEGDAFFPEFDESLFEIVHDEPHEPNEDNTLAYRFVVYQRR